MRVTPERVEAIKQVSRPRNLRSLRRLAFMRALSPITPWMPFLCIRQEGVDVGFACCKNKAPLSVNVSVT